jgi:hypothetical protein
MIQLQRIILVLSPIFLRYNSNLDAFTYTAINCISKDLKRTESTVLE